MNNRLSTLDAMRGIAALTVAFYHIGLVSFEGIDHGAIGLIKEFCSFGYLGVAVFFVISGFVISATLEHKPVSGGYFGRFLVRRSIRLDPTYWCSIALDIMLVAIAIKLSMPNPGLPDVQKTLLNMFYLQNLTGAGNIAAVYWTLCLEIQFYIVYGLILVAGFYRGVAVQTGLLVAVTLYSLIVAAHILPAPQGLFVSHWTLFALGIVAYHFGIYPDRPLWPFLAMIGASLAACVMNPQTTLLAACATAVMFFVGARKHKLNSWLKHDVLLYLGSRSYSIYLFHAIIGERAVKMIDIVGKKVGLTSLPGWELALFGLGLTASLIAAEVVYRLVELPSLRLSRRIRMQPAPSPLASAAAPQ